MKTPLASVAAVAVAGLLLVPAGAAAKPGSRSFIQTYPIASRLCAKVAAGKPPKRLKGDESQLTGDCTALQSSYNSAVNTAQAALQTYTIGVQNAKNAQQQACQPTGTPACKAARKTKRQALRSLRANRKLAVRQFHLSIEQARVTFWSAVHALRGGAGIAPDKPQPNSPVPSSS